MDPHLFHCDPDLALYLNADPDPDFKVTNGRIFMCEIYLNVGLLFFLLLF